MLDRILSMNAAGWFGIYVLLALTLWITIRVAYWLACWVALLLTFSLLKHLVYSDIFEGVARFVPFTRFQVMLVGGYAAANALCMGLGVRSLTEVSSRSALLSAVNAIPLLASAKRSLAVDFLGVSLRAQEFLHQSVGVIVTIEAFIHAVVESKKVVRVKLDSGDLFGMIVRISSDCTVRR